MYLDYDSIFWFSFSPLLVHWKYVDWKEGCVSKNKSTNKILIVSHHHEQVRICFHTFCRLLPKKKKKHHAVKHILNSTKQGGGWLLSLKWRKRTGEGGKRRKVEGAVLHYCKRSTSPPSSSMHASRVLHCQRASNLNTTTLLSIERDH